jgi:hypothetical protein
VSVAAFEADGSTPVALFDPPGIVATPEPGTGWFLLVMLIAVVAAKIRSRAQVNFTEHAQNGRGV